jgi:hypothetical protein
MRRPDEQQPESAGDHAGERLREFLDKRKPQDKPDIAPASGVTPQSSPPEGTGGGQAPGKDTPRDP